MSAIICKAILRCRSHFSIAKAIIKPPINKKTVLSPYEEVVAPISSPPVNGNNIIGNNDVAGIGIASVIHQIAIQIVLAKMARLSLVKPSGEKYSKVIINKAGP